MKREDKQRVVADLHAAWSEADAGVVTHYRGLTVSEMGELRRRLRDAGVSFKVVKKTLAKRAAEGTDFQVAEDLFTGPIAVAHGEDPVGMAKAIAGFAKEHEALEITGGLLDGKRIEAADVRALASLPSREELLAKLLGTLQSPITGFARVLSEVPTSFVRALGAVRDQKESAANG